MANPQEERIAALIAQLSGGAPPLMGVPRPNYSLTGNQFIDLALAQYTQGQGLAGPGKFLPQLYPAQNLLDQMVSAKYSAASMQNAEFLRNKDNAVLATRLEGVRNRYDSSPITEAGRAELRNFAGYMNNPVTQQLLSMTMGPQLMEDVFFGQRGSAQMLGNAVNQIGFYRPDAVTGQRRMSGDSLKTFSTQLYDNLYGPGADLNDVSGLSAGRVGSIMTDLAQRGLLPESFGKLTAKTRQQELGSGLKADIEKLDIDPALKTALSDANTSLDDISQMAGGADALRKVDATRVSRALKEYTGAIATVREIFGDNGITNAPMNQLLSAMEALTQNSMSSMKPGQIEALMRRTQMASRDSGVSLEALLGLTARTGAIADKYGLPRELAAEGTITAMERVQGLRDARGFRPGFGRLDPNKALLSFADEGMRVMASKVGRYVGAAQHAANQGLVADGSDLQRMLTALNKGDQTMTLNGETVNIYEELARNPAAFTRPMFEAAGINQSHVDALLDSPESREALLGMSGLQLHLSAGFEVKRVLGENLYQRGTLANAMTEAVKPEDRLGLAKELSTALGKGVIDDVNTQATPSARIAALRERALNVFRQRVMADPANAALDFDAITTKAEELMNATYGGSDKVNNLMSQVLGGAEQYSARVLNRRLPELQQALAENVTSSGARIRQENLARAAMFDIGGAALTGDGSNFAQRIADAFTSGSGGLQDAFNVGLGIVSNEEVAKKMRETLGAKNEKIYNDVIAGVTSDYEKNVYDTAADHDKIIEMAKTDFAGAAKYFEIYDASGKATGELPKALKDKTNIVSTKTLTAQLTEKLKNDDAFKKHISTELGVAINPDDVDAVRALAQRTDIDFQLDKSTITEAQMRQVMLTPGQTIVAPGGFDAVLRQEGLSRYIKTLRDGNNTMAPSSIFKTLGVADEKFAKDADVREHLETIASGRDAEEAEEKLRRRMEATGADAETIDKTIALGKVFGGFALHGGADALGISESAAAAKMREGAGPLAGLADELSSAIAAVFSSEKMSANFNEVKVNTLQVVGSAKELLNAAPVAGGGRGLTITGELQIVSDFKKAIVTLIEERAAPEVQNALGDGAAIRPAVAAGMD